jgi:acetyl-CoA acetyltransferase
MTVALVGVGYTPFTRSSGCSTLELARQACIAALADAGLSAKQVDGIASFMVLSDSVPTQAVATVLGVSQLRIGLDVNLGGQAPCFLIAQAAAAIDSGQAEIVLVYRAMNGRSGPRVGSMQFSGGAGQYRYPIGYSAYMMYVAMWAKRFLHETNQGERDLAAVAIAQRAYAEVNERAYRRTPLDFPLYLDSPTVVEPFRAADCTIEVDGACALVVTSLERARDLARPPVIVASGGYRAGRRAGLDIGDHLRWEDYSRNYTSWIASDLFGRAGLSPADVDIAEIYDCFSSTVLIGLEGLGLCGRGESGNFIRNGETAITGSLPTNTHGGLLSEGYLHGMNTVSEAVLQIQGRGGDRQAPAHEVCVVTSGALMDGSALILTSDR